MKSKEEKNSSSDFNFVEKPSAAHIKNVFKAVEAELHFNKSRAQKPMGALWFSGALSCLVVAVIYFQFINPVQTSTDLDVALSENLLMELAALSPDEVEMVDDLEFMDALDSLSPEELREIM